MFGLNLGGWLITEPWMNASLFGGSQCKDEYSLLKTESGQAKIQHHHQTFITEEDFKWLKAHDIEIIRLRIVLQECCPE